jgi:hypothetical protein
MKQFISFMILLFTKFTKVMLEGEDE